MQTWGNNYSRNKSDMWTTERETAEGANRSSTFNPADTGAGAKATGQGYDEIFRRICGIIYWFKTNVSRGEYNQDWRRQTFRQVDSRRATPVPKQGVEQL